MDDSVENKETAISQSILEQFRVLSKDKEQQLIEKPKEKKGVKRDIKEVEVKLDSSPSHHKGISENDVGITEYTTKNLGFRGIIKHRFSDFQVNEIDPEGNVVELTSLEVPKEKIEIPDNLDYKKVLSDEQWRKLEEIINNQVEEEQIEIDVTDKSKEERTSIHKAVKITFGTEVFSNTVEKDGKKCINIGRCTKKGRDRHQGGKFLHFSLYKENMDTTQTIHTIAKLLRLKPNLISYAGTKDKRGKTTQRMCVKQRSAEVLSKLKIRRVTMGNFRYSHKPLRLGKLSGNQFRLAIRDVKEDDAVINEELENFGKIGFINYFGLQRFGSSLVVPTYAIGKELLTANWKEAVELILKPKNGEKCPQDIKKAREVWWESRDATKAVECLSKFDNTVEGRVLQALKSQGDKAYYNAIFAIPRNTLLLYLHSYQSLIWNRVISRRIKEFGMKPITGDLVLDVDSSQTENVSDDIEEEEGVDRDNSENIKDDDDEPEAHADAQKSEATENIKKVPVKVLTEEEAKEASIYDIVYPLLGFDIEYPKNIVGKWFVEALKMDDISEENLKSHKSFSISGAYRKMVCNVEGLSWKIVHYQDPNEDLILSDIDKMENKTLPSYPDDSEHKAVLLELRLKPSQYATMALREVMKCNTSGNHQATLSQDHSSIETSKKAKLE